MKNQISKSRIAIALLAVTAGVVAVSLVLALGCTKRLDGEVTANQKPIVYFVNIPPEGQRFSRNPEIHWVGTDRDGLIAYFRYHVATASDLGGLDPMDYIMTVPTNSWIRLDVDPKGPDPMTSNIVSMSADLTDPVLTYVDQYVFLQAFDEEGLGSDIVYRLFSRNDNPPSSFILGFNAPDLPFVNSVEPGGIITGVKLRWIGDDPIDYPSDPPPFEFDWRLYGPYFPEEMNIVRDSFMTQVYVTNDGGVYRIGDTVIRCDTFYVESGFQEQCDTLVVTASTQASAFGAMEDYFRVDDLDFVGSTYDRVQQRSGVWVTATADTLWNVFAGFHSDTTVEMQFVLWLRARDDARVPDLVPYYREFPVIDPRYERDVAVLDFTKPTSSKLSEPIMGPLPTDRDTIKFYWKRALDAWGENTGRDIVFDTAYTTVGPLAQYLVSPDYMFMGRLGKGAPIAELLKHKVLIIYDDALTMPQEDQWTTIYKAIDAGINVWLTGRTTVIDGNPSSPPGGRVPPFPYLFYFGVDSMGYSGWASYFPPPIGWNIPTGYYQDFIGTFSTKPGEWPDLQVDTALLHSRYRWSIMSYDYWRSDYPGLPEVDWCVRSFGTEILYKYKSVYGSSHPLGGSQVFHGRPVGHRLATSLFKTVHFNFTPLAMEQSTMQVVVDSVLNWLYDPTLGQGDGQAVSENRYPDARVRVSLAEARRNYEVRCEEYEKRRQEAIVIE